MKSVFTILVFLGITASAAAQTESGNLLVGGSINLNTAKNSTQVSIAPTVGYFFAHNFAAGGSIEYTHSRASNSTETTFGIGPFARYYFGNSMIRPLVHANVNFTSNKRKVDAVSSTANGSDYFLGAGLADFINRNVAIEALAGYYHANLTDQEGSGGFNLRIGFQVYLSRHMVKELTR